MDNRIYAIKSIPLGQNKIEESRLKQMQEVEMLKELKHPNIIEYFCYFLGPDFGNRVGFEDINSQSKGLDQHITD